MRRHWAGESPYALRKQRVLWLWSLNPDSAAAAASVWPAAIGLAALGARSEGAAAPAFRSGYVLAVANPKAYAALGALNASHQVTGAGGATEAGVKILALTLVIVVSMSLWSVFDAGLARLLRRPVTGARQILCSRLCCWRRALRRRAT